MRIAYLIGGRSRVSAIASAVEAPESNPIWVYIRVRTGKGLVEDVLDAERGAVGQ